MTWAAVAAGGATVCALTSEGAAYCWGGNQFGLLGRGDAGDDLPHPTPERVVGGLKFTSIASSVANSCALTEDGSAYCWGLNSVGQLGVDPMLVDQSSTPVAVSGDHIFTAIAAGGGHACAISGEGAAYCWGENSFGELGDGTRSTAESQYEYTPVRVLGGLAFSAIANGVGFSCGIAADAAAYCWGRNEYGQLGIGAKSAYELTPHRSAADHGFSSIAAYGQSACGLTPDGDAYCWGQNYFGELGIGLPPDTGSQVVAGYPTPTLVVGGQRFAALSREAYHSCGLGAAGEVYCWGDGENGGLGVNPATLPTCNTIDEFPCSVTPVQAQTDLKFTSVTAGHLSTCGITADGALYCWGDNTWGELGDGTTISSVVPVRVPVPQSPD